MKTYIVDTYAWVSYFGDVASPFKSMLEGNYLETPALALSELTRILVKRKFSAAERRQALDYVVQNSLVLPLTAELAIAAGNLCEAEGLHLADAIVYSYASAEKKLLTGDKHFSGKPFAHFLSCP